MRKGFLTAEEMRKFFPIYEVAVYITLHPIPLNFLIYEENFIFFCISAEGLSEDGGRADFSKKPPRFSLF
jgi:hypothetical protein